MINKKSKLMSMAASLMMMDQMMGNGLVEKKECISKHMDKINTTQHQVVPKGAKRFYFGKNGNLLPTVRDKEQPNYDQPIGEVAYKCIALSEKRAIEKFNKNYN